MFRIMHADSIISSLLSVVSNVIVYKSPQSLSKLNKFKRMVLNLSHLKSFESESYNLINMLNLLSQVKKIAALNFYLNIQMFKDCDMLVLFYHRFCWNEWPQNN